MPSVNAVLASYVHIIGFVINGLMKEYYGFERILSSILFAKLAICRGRMTFIPPFSRGITSLSILLISLPRILCYWTPASLYALSLSADVF